MKKVNIERLLRDVEFGFELECIVPGIINHDQLRERLVDMLPQFPYAVLSQTQPATIKGSRRENFHLMFDESIQADIFHPKWNPGKHHLTVEIVSPVFKIDKIQNKEFCPLLKALRTLGAYTTKTCGIHIHMSISDVYASYPYLHKFLLAEAIKVFDNTTWKRRKKFCSPDNPAHRRHGLVNQCSQNHWEVRCFNGSLDDRAVSNAVWTCARAFELFCEELEGLTQKRVDIAQSMQLAV